MRQTNITTQTNLNLINNQILINIFNKRKLDFRYLKGNITKLIKKISPIYREFFLKVIKSGNVKIKVKGKGSMHASCSDGRATFSKKQPVFLYVDTSLDSFAHELGHACDYWFGEGLSLTKNVFVESDKTLSDIFNEEFEKKYKEIYELVMNEYKHIINTTISPKAFDILSKKYSKYQTLLTTEDEKVRKQLHKELYESGFVDTYYQLYTKKCYFMLNHKYGPVLDALSSKYNFDGFFLYHHANGYYEGKNPVHEFFANLFEAELTSQFQHFESLNKLLPKSFSAFQKLFSIFYERIINNKRFTDLKSKKEVLLSEYIND